MPSVLHTTETALLAAGVLLLASVLAGRFSSRSGVPVLVLFLALGMLAGSEGIGGIDFADYALTYRIGMIALVLILFNGGLRTPATVARAALAPATVLATVGVLVTAGLITLGAHLLGLSWTDGLLLGAVVSSTDAAAVFSVLRGSGLHLQERVSAVAELESGLNDPMAALLTVAMVQVAGGGHRAGIARLALGLVGELAIGGAIGAAIGFAAREVVARIRLRTAGLYPVLTLAIAFITYGAASVAAGSGLLAVYVAGVVLGNAWLPNRAALLRVHDFVAWAGQIVMFLVLGLLAAPSRVIAVAPIGLALAAFLVLFVRPVAVLVCLAPSRFSARETALVAWLGLRGAVPIILAVIPVLQGVPGATTIFDVVFFVVLASALVQGGTVGWVTRRLKLGRESPPKPPALVEIEATLPLHEEISSFRIEAPSAVCGVRLADIPFPEDASVILVVRDGALVAPRGDTVLREGDQAFVFCRHEDGPLVRLLFGREEE